jgi:hypothetical protein
MIRSVSSCLEGTVLTKGLVRSFLPEENFGISLVVEKRNY